MLYVSEYYGVCSISDSLVHHGIKGQRWYHRRFQNEDGSLTAAGRERYLTKMQKKYNLVDVPRNTAAAIDNARDIKSNGGSDRVANKYLKKAGVGDVVYYSKRKERYFSDDELDKRGQKELKRDQAKAVKLRYNADKIAQERDVMKYQKQADISKKVLATAATVAVSSLPLGEMSRHHITNEMFKMWANQREADRVLNRQIHDIIDKPHWFDNANDKRLADRLIDEYKNNSDITAVATQHYGEKAEKARTNSRIVALAGAATAAGAGAAYAYNTYRGNKAKKRLTDDGHAKAVRERDEYEKRMRKKYGKNWR